MTEAPSLYRRHRPRAFDEVVGQEAVVRTLRNAVEQGKVHHAYLFVGSRGTGKTSMAKILAACLNCERGPTTQPCGRCESCRSIAAATSLDVIELDAASNNSVDDIRELRERVAYAPVSGRHKVYILDEAHMLSTQAWNAFLKTLEEPPPNTIFVLATTDPQKVLPTVVDRCHRFDFARPSADQIATVLRRTAEAEGIELPDAACALIARRAGGSFRDALGDLEQIVTYSGPRIELEAVLAVLNLPDADLLFEATGAVAAADPARGLRAVARLGDSGRDSGQFLRDLEEHARALLVVQALGEVPPELRVSPEQDARLADQADEMPRSSVVRLLDVLAEAMEGAKAGADARIQLELALVKAAAPDLDPSVRALLARIERLEERLGPPRPVRAVSEQPVEAPESPARAPRPKSPPAGGEVEGRAPAAAAVAVAGEPAGALAADPRPPIPPQAGPEPAPADRDRELDLDAINSLWPSVIETIRGDNAMLAALLEGARPVALHADELRLAFPESAAFLKRKAEDVRNRQAAGRALEAVAGRSLRLSYELRADEDAGPDGDGPAMTADELVARLMEEFDAEELRPDRDEEPATAERDE
ncbi:MAG: DNA polymerase III subunit gamma/tau [Solirubrobacteraceae bacterium]